MGFRSTMVSEDWDVKWPGWFLDAWPGLIYEAGGSGILGLLVEVKAYGRNGLPADIQRALVEVEFRNWPFVYVWLHECGGVTRVQIDRDTVTVTEPDGWTVVESGDQSGEHSYCYGCSDARKPDPVVIDGTIVPRAITR